MLPVADAERAAAAGRDGIILSNYCGQADGAIAALAALPAIAAVGIPASRFRSPGCIRH
jgi:hypothetical protein